MFVDISLQFHRYVNRTKASEDAYQSRWIILSWWRHPRTPSTSIVLSFPKGFILFLCFKPGNLSLEKKIPRTWNPRHFLSFLFLLLSINFEVLGFVKLKIQPLPFRYDSPLLPFSYVDCTHLKRFQRSFVITYMDKCSNNFVFLSEALSFVGFNDIISLEDTHVKSRLSESVVKFFIVLSTLLLSLRQSVDFVFLFFLQFGCLTKTTA